MKRCGVVSWGVLALAACQPASKATEIVPPQAAATASDIATNQTITPGPTQTPANQPSANQPPAKQSLSPAQKLTVDGGELRGVLTSLEDAGYPMFRATFTLADGGTVEALFNNEGLTVKGDASDLVGKPVSATITTSPSANLLRLDANGKSVFEMSGEEGQPADIPADAKKITGVLRGAKEPTGDLPGNLSVTSPDGTVVKFQEFFDPKLAAQDGKTVTMTYVTFIDVDVTNLKALTP